MFGDITKCARSVNRGEYRVMEDSLAKAIKEGIGVEMEGKVIYTENSIRPKEIVVTVNKTNGESKGYTFSNEFSMRKEK